MKFKDVFLTFGVWLGLVAFGAPLAADLDSVVSQTPTVRSEIARGFNSETQCIVDDQSAYELFKMCSEHIELENSSKLTDPRAYKLGASIFIWLQYTKFQKIAKNREIYYLSCLASQINYLLLKNRQEKLEITDAQLNQILESLQINDAYNNFKIEIQGPAMCRPWATTDSSN